MAHTPSPSESGGTCEDESHQEDVIDSITAVLCLKTPLCPRILLRVENNHMAFIQQWEVLKESQ